MRSAIRAASQLPREELTVVDDAHRAPDKRE